MFFLTSIPSKQVSLQLPHEAFEDTYDTFHEALIQQLLMCLPVLLTLVFVLADFARAKMG